MLAEGNIQRRVGSKLNRCYGARWVHSLYDGTIYFTAVRVIALISRPLCSLSALRVYLLLQNTNTHLDLPATTCYVAVGKCNMYVNGAGWISSDEELLSSLCVMLCTMQTSRRQ